MYTLRGEIQMKRTSNGFELKSYSKRKTQKKIYIHRNIHDIKTFEKFECHKFDETEKKITHC